MSHYIYYVTITWFCYFFEFFNSDFLTLSVELIHDMGTMQKLLTWSSEKKSQKLEKSTLKKMRLSKLFETQQAFLHM